MPKASIASSLLRCDRDPLSVYHKLKKNCAGPSAFLDSARSNASDCRYSVIALEPYMRMRYDGKTLISHQDQKSTRIRTQDPLPRLRRVFERMKVRVKPKDGIFWCGAIGYFCYEAVSLFEPAIARKSCAPYNWFDLLFFKKSIIFDHRERIYRLYAYGRNASLSKSNLKIWKKRVEDILAVDSQVNGAQRHDRPASIRALNSRSLFEDQVRQVKRHIKRGDIFQANLSQKIILDASQNWEQFYSYLRSINPSGFQAILDCGDTQIYSGSPERLIQKVDRMLQTKPIAGTHRRGISPQADRKLRRRMHLSSKEKAEHIMLVDLERNDMGRVCEFGSVRVTKMMATEKYSHVQHIVSTVTGRMRLEKHMLDAFGVFFPGGTITGTPKIRCIELLRGIEKKPRGPYTGSLGYFSYTQDMDWNILIRSVFVNRRSAFTQVGAGIVSDSKPSKEYAETLYKAKAILQAYRRG